MLPNVGLYHFMGYTGKVASSQEGWPEFVCGCGCNARPTNHYKPLGCYHHTQRTGTSCPEARYSTRQGNPQSRMEFTGARASVVSFPKGVDVHEYILFLL